MVNQLKFRNTPNSNKKKVNLVILRKSRATWISFSYNHVDNQYGNWYFLTKSVLWKNPIFPLIKITLKDVTKK